MKHDIESVLVTRDEIKEMVKDHAARISNEYEGKELVLIGVLKGGFVFMADLVKEITIPITMDFISVSSYGASTETSGIVRILKDTDIDLKGKHLIIVEDIVDSGLTLVKLKEIFNTREPLSIKVCAAFDKPSGRKIKVDVEFKGIEIPNKFVVGYGLDYAEKYRNLSELCVLKEEVYTKK